ncbi:MAG: hypothetical protein HQM10_04630 [Candidatus Riflebacteria bacterium]|nr:hypothetical protein [Candidatus Riflebacteria bacterium]
MNVATMRISTTPDFTKLASKKNYGSGSGEVFFRMEKSTPPASGIENEFWDIIQKMPRADQLSMGASALVRHISSNSEEKSNSEFIKSFKNRFSEAELKEVQKILMNHPMVKGKSEKEVSEFVNYLNEIWKTTPALEVQETPNYRKEGIPFRSPDTIFFQTSFLRKKSDAVKPVAGLS